MLRRDMFRLGLIAGAGVALPVEVKALPRRPPRITVRSEVSRPLTHDELGDNFRAVRALIERLEWRD